MTSQVYCHNNYIDIMKLYVISFSPRMKKACVGCPLENRRICYNCLGVDLALTIVSSQNILFRSELVSFIIIRINC